jgi:hypothetical protein
MAAKVSLEHNGEPQRLVSHLLMGSTMEVLLEPRKTEMSAFGARHAAASGLAAIPVSALLH